MTDRVHPKAAAAATAVPILNPPPSKSHLYNPARHPYRPTPPPAPSSDHRRRRFFSWSILALFALLLLASIAFSVTYSVYRPRRPLFSVTSLKISAFNLTTTPPDDSTQLTTRINVTLSTRNPNSRIAYLYGPASISVQWGAIVLSSGSFANFVSSPGNISVIHAETATNFRLLDAGDVNTLRSGMKRKRGLPVEIAMDAVVGVKMEKTKMGKVGIRIRCGGMHGILPRGRHVIPGNTARAKCMVDFKFLTWTF